MANETQWRPGFRRVPPGTTPGRFSDKVATLGDIGPIRIMVLVEEPKPADEFSPTPEPGKDVILQFQYPGQKSFRIKLSSFNAEELSLFGQALTHALILAKPVVDKRDQAAEEAAQNGDDSYIRRHRGSPKVSYFKREV